MKLLLTVVEEIGMWKVARPTQANGRLEWGTQHLFMTDPPAARAKALNLHTEAFSRV
jgi:hypothetical protein